MSDTMVYTRIAFDTWYLTVTKAIIAARMITVVDET